MKVDCIFDCGSISFHNVCAITRWLESYAWDSIIHVLSFVDSKIEDWSNDLCTGYSLRNHEGVDDSTRTYSLLQAVETSTPWWSNLKKIKTDTVVNVTLVVILIFWKVCGENEKQYQFFIWWLSNLVHGRERNGRNCLTSVVLTKKSFDIWISFNSNLRFPNWNDHDHWAGL